MFEIWSLWCIFLFSCYIHYFGVVCSRETQKKWDSGQFCDRKSCYDNLDGSPICGVIIVLEDEGDKKLLRYGSQSMNHPNFKRPLFVNGNLGKQVDK